MKLLVGIMNLEPLGGDKEIKIYSSDNKHFYDKNNRELNNEDLELWAVWVNSPWSSFHDNYDIGFNVDDAYSNIHENEPKYRCEKHILGYEGVYASVIGYGETEEEALKNSKELFAYLQKEYNKENEAI
jgi:hypothetical protein